MSEDTIEDESHASTADEAEASAPEPEPDPDAVAVTLNGKQIEARKGELVIAAAERHNTYIPHFCYHPRMSSVGMCRQCLVEVDTGRGMQLQPSCMITVSPDMVIDTESDTTKRAQEGMLELLLANHPLDCPVCDKGGECPLQDQAFSHGPGESRFVEEKRHYEKPIPISDLVLLDRERCILCDRCTRFADEVAGDKLIHFTQRGNQTQVMTFPDEPFASYFSGNTVQICPVGALTAEPYRFKARPWISRKRNRRARRARSAAARWCSRAVMNCCAIRVSTPTRSTTGGCAIAVDSTSRPSTPITASPNRWWPPTPARSPPRGALLSAPSRR